MGSVCGLVDDAISHTVLYAHHLVRCADNSQSARAQLRPIHICHDTESWQAGGHIAIAYPETRPSNHHSMRCTMGCVQGQRTSPLGLTFSTAIAGAELAPDGDLSVLPPESMLY